MKKELSPLFISSVPPESLGARTLCLCLDTSAVWQRRASASVWLNHGGGGAAGPAESGAGLLTFAVGRTSLSLQACGETTGQDGRPPSHRPECVCVCESVWDRGGGGTVSSPLRVKSSIPEGVRAARSTPSDTLPRPSLIRDEKPNNSRKKRSASQRAMKRHSSSEVTWAVGGWGRHLNSGPLHQKNNVGELMDSLHAATRSPRSRFLLWTVCVGLQLRT